MDRKICNCKVKESEPLLNCTASWHHTDVYILWMFDVLKLEGM